MVSALKVNGKRLHVLAREGVVVEREPRTITVSSFSLAPTSTPNEWSFDVTCSVGTYVRVLLSDLAERLTTLGHLSALRRVASGTHDVKDALTLDEIESRVLAGVNVVMPPTAFVDQLESALVSAEEEKRLRMGQRVSLSAPIADEIAALNDAGSLVAVLQRRGDVWQPVVVMPDENANAHE